MQTIGERLEEARKRKGISIREAAEATKIRGDYLHKFEGNQFDINLPEIYVRGFLRTYAAYLKLPADKISADYNALGLGQPKSRNLNRETFGRMDLSVASAKDGVAESAGVPAEKPVAENEERNPATFVPRATGIQIDRDLLIKGIALVGGAVILIVLIIWGISAMTGGGSPVEPSTETGTQQRMITLVALDTVVVSVHHRNADNTEGAELFRGTLARGQSQEVAWPGPIYIRANAGENLQVEFRGERYPTGFTGTGRAQM